MLAANSATPIAVRFLGIRDQLMMKNLQQLLPVCALVLALASQASANTDGVDLDEVIVIALRLPVPGPVVGMVLLFLALLLRGRVSQDLESTAQGLLNHLALMFVPAGTGIVVYLELLRQEWLPITVALIGSTVLTIAVTALTLQTAIRRRSHAQDRKGASG